MRWGFWTKWWTRLWRRFMAEGRWQWQSWCSVAWQLTRMTIASELRQIPNIHLVTPSQISQQVSFNGHRGEWDEDGDEYFSSRRAYQANNGISGFNSFYPYQQFVYFRLNTQTSPSWTRQHGPIRVAILCIVFVFVCLLGVASIASLICRAKSWSLQTKEDPAMLYLHRHRHRLASLPPPSFTYERLESSRNGFDPKHKIGDGRFGSVYLGQLHGSRIVAVKHLQKHHPTTVVAAAEAKAFSTESFCNQILILSSINCLNLVKLHRYCSDPRGLHLVYDYVPNKPSPNT